MFHFRLLSKSVATLEDMEKFDKATEKLGEIIPHFFPQDTITPKLDIIGMPFEFLLVVLIWLLRLT